MRDDDRAARVVRFWRAVEMFSPQPLPKLSEVSAARGGVLDLAANELAPWEPGHPLQANPLPNGKTWQFTVYGGRFDIRKVRDELVSAFGADNKPADGRAGGGTALFGFTLDATGHMLPDSTALSSCAWTIGRLRSPGPGDPSWLDGFEEDERAFVEALNKLVPPERGPSGAGEPVSGGEGRVRGAVREAVAAGVNEVGAVVGTVTATAVGSVAGSVVGGIAGKAAGAFVARLLAPAGGRGAAGSAGGGSPTVVPRLRITGRSVHEFVAELAAAFGVGASLAPRGVRVRCAVVPARGNDDPEPAFLNSLVTNDLARLEKAIGKGDVGSAFRGYVSDSDRIAVRNRVDVRAARTAVLNGVLPTRTPAGRWPTGLDRPLVVSQQFAVNQVMREVAGETGIFAVNGPPGTGKTTMLRDVLAAIVVARAERLAELRRPEEAFTGVVGEVALTPKYKATVRAMRSDLTGFEVVVATAGNDAAENVTAEIPALAAVAGAEEAALAADYFPALASHVLGAEAWGLVTAVLGNMKNRSAFAQRFWYGADATGGQDAVVGMRNLLRAAMADPAAVPDWAQAVKEFRDAEERVRELAEERELVAGQIDQLTTLTARLPLLREAVGQAAEACEETRQLLALCTAALDKAEAAYAKADDDYRAHALHKPSFWICVATFFRAPRRWYAESERLSGLRADARDLRDQLAGATAERKAELAENSLVRQRCENAVRDAEHDLAATRARIDAALERWPGTVPFGERFDDDAAFQLCAPWADEEFTAARNAVFLAALRLHKSFVLNAASRIRGNLAVLATSLRSQLPLDRRTLEAAWQSLFLVVPMVSTTFASVSRLFDGLGRESLGWLFVDEAGQATPQQPAGGIWRTRRAVIVGDPRQLEPIVTLPSTAQEAMLRYFRVADEWLPDATSAQRVADRLARYGAFLAEPDGEAPTWVGAPLRVHRRCDRPMFDISNDIAYGGDLMVYGTAERGRFPGANVWLDVPSGQARGNWVLAEGDALAALLGRLAGEGVDTGEIRVISPFRDVVRGSKEVAGRVLGATFAAANVGTVHTVQGQEADVVVLVLGSGPRNQGARNWAAESPNLLNVAVSRAKRRFYVIGDRSRWQGLPYFSVLAATLDHRAGM